MDRLAVGAGLEDVAGVRLDLGAALAQHPHHRADQEVEDAGRARKPKTISLLAKPTSRSRAVVVEGCDHLPGDPLRLVDRAAAGCRGGPCTLPAWSYDRGVDPAGRDQADPHAGRRAGLDLERPHQPCTAHLLVL